jgi:hypothetical protein
MDDKENWDDLFFIHKESRYYILIQEALELRIHPYGQWEPMLVPCAKF